MPPYSHMKDNTLFLMFFVLEMRLAMMYLQFFTGLPIPVVYPFCNCFSVSMDKLTFT